MDVQTDGRTSGFNIAEWLCHADAPEKHNATVWWWIIAIMYNNSKNARNILWVYILFIVLITKQSCRFVECHRTVKLHGLFPTLSHNRPRSQTGNKSGLSGPVTAQIDTRASLFRDFNYTARLRSRWSRDSRNNCPSKITRLRGHF